LTILLSQEVAQVAQTTLAAAAVLVATEPVMEVQAAAQALSLPCL
jgi:hypothetical protein